MSSYRELAQDDQGALAQAWLPWVNSVYTQLTGQAPPMEVAMTFAEGLAAGRTTSDDVLAIVQGG